MKKYTQDEIDVRADELVAKFEHEFHADLRIQGAALISLFDTAVRSDVSDVDIDAAVAEARRAGHTWDEISAVLHVAKTPIAAT